MNKKEEKIEEIEEFKIEEIKESKTNKTHSKYTPEQYIIALEHAFEEYRIYGDERDIKLFKIKEGAVADSPCMIQRVSGFFHPRNLANFNNQMVLNHRYVEDLINRFKEYRKTHDEIPFDIKRGFKPEIDGYHQFER